MSDFSIVPGSGFAGVARLASAALRRRGSRGRWAALEALARHAAWLGFFAALAPILGPGAYGLVALAMTGLLVIDSGLREVVAGALCGLASVEEGHLSMAFIASTAVGGALSLLLYLLAALSAAMFDDPACGDILLSLSLLPLLSALTAVPLALLRRRARLFPLVAAALAGSVVGGSVAVALARVGCGPWSLVALIVTQRFVEVAFLWVGAGRLIGLRWSRRHLRDLAAAVDAAVAAPIAAALARQLPRLIIALLLGPIAAGLYLLAARFAEALSDVVVAPLAPPIPVAPSECRAALVRRLRPALRRAGVVAVLAVIGSMGLVESTVLHLVDLTWWGAVRPAEILLLTAIPLVMQRARTASLLGAGRGIAEAGWLLAQNATLAIVVAIAAPYGLVAVAVAILAHGLLVAIAGLVPMRRALGSDFRGLFDGLVRPFTLAAGAALALIAAQKIAGALLPPFPVQLLATLGLGAVAVGIILTRPVMAGVTRQNRPHARRRPDLHLRLTNRP